MRHRTHLLAHLTTNVSKTLLAIEALRLETAVTKHLDDLGILLAVFTEDELALVIVVLVLSTSPVLSTLLVFAELGHPLVAYVDRGLTFPLFCMQYDNQ